MVNTDLVAKPIPLWPFIAKRLGGIGRGFNQFCHSLNAMVLVWKLCFLSQLVMQEQTLSKTPVA